MNIIKSGLLVSLLIVSPTLATASEVDGRVGVASQYTGKGLGKSDEDPAAFVGARWSRGAVYGDLFISQASSSRNADAELIAIVGYEADLAAVSIDTQVLYRETLGETAGVDSGYWEYQADVVRKFSNKVSGRFRVNYSADTYGGAQRAWWIEPQLTVTLTPKDRLSAAYGVRDLDVGSDYSAWNVGVKHKFTPSVAGDLRWFDTDGHDLGERYEGRLVASLTYSF
jgi:uncharacterized protein (TIGR02001 family)